MKVELANDLIAKKVYEAASVEDKARSVARKFIKDRYSHFAKSKQMLLSRQELAFIQPYVDKLILDPQQKDYITRSRQKIQKEKKRKRWRDAGVVALVCVIILSSWGLWERNRYTITYNNLAVAQDSIGQLLRDARSATAKKAEPEPTAAIVAFHTIHLEGYIKNSQGTAIEGASIQILGADIQSNAQGYYSLHLVLPPQYWSQPPVVTIKKENYKAANYPLDIDKDQVDWNPVLVPQY